MGFDYSIASESHNARLLENDQVRRLAIEYEASRRHSLLLDKPSNIIIGLVPDATNFWNWLGE
jgi:hypothetical protein